MSIDLDRNLLQYMYIVYSTYNNNLLETVSYIKDHGITFFFKLQFLSAYSEHY